MNTAAGRPHNHSRRLWARRPRRDHGTALASRSQPATRRAYRTAWKAFEDFAANHGATLLPAAPEPVAAYLASRKADGGGMPTLRMACAAIAAAHDLTGHANPCTDRLVKTAMKGFGRQAAEAGQSARQAQALTAEAVAAIRGVAINGKTDSSIRAARDMAMVSVLAEAGLRRSRSRRAHLGGRDGGSGRKLVASRSGVRVGSASRRRRRDRRNHRRSNVGPGAPGREVQGRASRRRPRRSGRLRPPDCAARLADGKAGRAWSDSAVRPLRASLEWP